MKAIWQRSDSKLPAIRQLTQCQWFSPFAMLLDDSDQALVRNHLTTIDTQTLQPTITNLSHASQKKTQHWATQWINSVFFQLRNPIIWNPLPFLLILLERPWVADDDEVLVYLNYKENENIFFILNTIESLFLHRYGT